MRDARVEELEQKNTIVEQGVTSVSVQPQNDKEAILEVLLSIDIPVSAVNVPSFVMDQKSSERIGRWIFLDEVHKKKNPTSTTCNER
ncbi:unnamed protein product [Rhizophagus irregularis]|nr:unnamed protein product [Rhizophagus irregularis]